MSEARKFIVLGLKIRVPDQGKNVRIGSNLPAIQ
jgi:hypothetical protein